MRPLSQRLLAHEGILETRRVLQIRPNHDVLLWVLPRIEIARLPTENRIAFVAENLGIGTVCFRYVVGAGTHELHVLPGFVEESDVTRDRALGAVRALASLVGVEEAFARVRHLWHHKRFRKVFGIAKLQFCCSHFLNI